jgi:hypothetical protein
MPSRISKLGKILKTLNRLEGIKEFNASLPVKIEVKKEINPITYLIKLGKREVETKSKLPLKEGEKFFAEIKEHKSGIKITNLKKYPKILELLEKIHINEKEKNLSKKLFEDKKEEIISHISRAETKEEFIFFSNLLIALDKNIRHLIIAGKKEKALLQYKKEKNRLTFYAVFKHLGELEGIVEKNKLTIFSSFDTTINLIKKHANELDMEVEAIKKNPDPLYFFTNSLLDIKV